MNTLEIVLRKLDVFYVPFTPSLNLKNKEIESSSVVGGLLTVIIYSFSFIYGIILLKQWYFYEMPFKIATQKKNSDVDFYNNYFIHSELKDSIVIEITYNGFDTIPYFKNDEVIFIPLLYDSNLDQTINLLNLYNISSDTITVEIQAGLVNQALYFVLVSCLENQHFLDTSQKCASQEIFDQKIARAGIEIDFTFETKTLDIQTKNISLANIYTLSFIQKGYSSVKFITLDYNHYTLLEGFFQEKQTEYMFLTDIEVRDQMGTVDYVTQYSWNFNPDFQNVYAGVSICSNSVINEINISYPTISEQLASINSITQVLLLIGIIIRFKNRKQMINQFKKEFRNKFFPEVELIQKRKSGKAHQYYYQNKKINSKSYSEFINQTEQKIDEKLNFFNLVYEISLIQLILEEMTTQYKLLQSHFKHFDLDLVYCRSDKEYHIINYWCLKSETQNLKRQQSLAPFSLNYSTVQQSEEFCKTLTNDPEQVSQMRTFVDQRYSSIRFCESKSIK